MATTKGIITSGPSMPEAIDADSVISLAISPFEEDLSFLQRMFGDAGWKLLVAHTYKEGMAQIERELLPVVICECQLADGNWKNVLSHLAPMLNPPRLIVVSRHADARLWLEVLNLGGFDLLATPKLRLGTRSERLGSIGNTHGTGVARLVPARRWLPQILYSCDESSGRTKNPRSSSLKNLIRGWWSMAGANLHRNSHGWIHPKLYGELYRPRSLRRRVVRSGGAVHRLGERRGCGEKRGMVSGCSFSYPVFEDIRAQNSVFSGVLADAGMDEVNLVANGHAGLAEMEPVSGEYFTTLGVQPIFGRAFTPEDNRPGAVPAAVIGEGLWERRFGRNASVLGKTISINGTTFTIVGVAPARFFGLQPGFHKDLWIPLAMLPRARSFLQASVFHNRDDWWVMVVGRLKLGVTEAKARAALNVIQQGQTAPPKPQQLPHMELSSASKGLARSSTSNRPAEIPAFA
jgi:MacB-like protein